MRLISTSGLCLVQAGCGSELPEGWEGAVPVEQLVQGSCDSSPDETGPTSVVTADLSQDPLQLEAVGVTFRCSQEVEGFWKQDGELVEVLVQPRDMHPRSVAKCDCAYDLDIVVGSPDPQPGRLILWKRGDARNEPNLPVEVGRVPAPAPCAERTGGALVTLEVAGESFALWSTEDTFIDAAKADLAAGSGQLPVFEQVLPGTDCDPQWSWHVEPAAMSWVDMAMELCDARPSYIESDPQAWMDQVGSWCPWSANTTAVDDRR